MSRRHLAALAAAALALPLTAAAQKPVATVDPQGVLEQSKDGKAALARMRKALETRQKELDAQAKAFQASSEQLEAQRKTLDAAALKKAVEENEKKGIELNLRTEKAKAEQEMLESKELQPLYARLDAALQTVIERHQVQLLLEGRRAGVLYIAPGADLTAEVLKTFDALPTPAPAGKAPAPGK
jgi:outer membrane protein